MRSNDAVTSLNSYHMTIASTKTGDCRDMDEMSRSGYKSFHNSDKCASQNVLMQHVLEEIT